MKTFPLILATTAAAAGQSVVWWLEHKTSLRVARTKGNVSIMAATSPDKSLCFTYNIQTHVHTHIYAICQDAAGTKYILSQTDQQQDE